MDDRITRTIFATAALAAVVGVLASPAGASVSEARQGESAVAVVVPYLSHGIGVDQTRFSGQASQSLAPQTIPYLSQGVGVDESQFAGRAAPKVGGDQVVSSPSSGTKSLGLNGDSPLYRALAAPTPTVSGGDDIDWTSFGAGAGMAALVAAAFAGILLTVRRRHPVGMP